MLSDTLFNLTPNQQGMMGLGAALMQAGGPSRMPSTFGQGLGNAYMQAMAIRQQAMQQAQMQKFREKQLSKIEHEMNLLEREQKVRDKIADQMMGGRMEDGSFSPGGLDPRQLMAGGIQVKDPAMMKVAAGMMGLGQGRPIVREFHEGDRLVTKQYVGGKWVPMGNAPRFGPKEVRDPISGFPILIDPTTGQELGRMERDPSNPVRRVWTKPGTKPAGNNNILLRQAREAIAAGADRNAVLQRLKQNGIDPSGL